MTFFLACLTWIFLELSWKYDPLFYEKVRILHTLKSLLSQCKNHGLNPTPKISNTKHRNARKRNSLKFNLCHLLYPHWKESWWSLSFWILKIRFSHRHCDLKRRIFTSLQCQSICLKTLGLLEETQDLDESPVILSSLA